MPYLPYADTPPRLRPETPQILTYFQNPKGLLAVNLARCEYRSARHGHLTHDAALECADAELDTIGLGGRDDVGEYVAADWDRVAPPVAAMRRAA